MAGMVEATDMAVLTGMVEVRVLLVRALCPLMIVLSFQGNFYNSWIKPPHWLTVNAAKLLIYSYYKPCISVGVDFPCLMCTIIKTQITTGKGIGRTIDLPPICQRGPQIMNPDRYAPSASLRAMEAIFLHNLELSLLLAV